MEKVSLWFEDTRRTSSQHLSRQTKIRVQKWTLILINRSFILPNKKRAFCVLTYEKTKNCNYYHHSSNSILNQLSRTFQCFRFFSTPVQIVQYQVVSFLNTKEVCTINQWKWIAQLIFSISEINKLHQQTVEFLSLDIVVAPKKIFSSYMYASKTK